MKIEILQHPDNTYRTQEQAILFHNQRNEPMLSFPNCWDIVKENNTEAIKAIRGDCNERWLYLSTQIEYSTTNLSGTIIHNAGSNTAKQKKIYVKEIPDYTAKKLPDVLDEEAGLQYVRALIDKPKATKEQIIKFFETLSGKKAEKVRFWTPTQSSRKERPVRSVELVFDYFDRFVVNGDIWLDVNFGFSRGVKVKSAKQTEFLSSKAIFDIVERKITIPLENKYRKQIEISLKKNKVPKIKWELKIKIQ